MGVGASCAACADRRRSHLKLVELGERWITLCHNCSAEVSHLDPGPRSIEALRERLTRDRRQRVRRNRAIDHSDYCDERRQTERRHAESTSNEDQWLDAEEYIIGTLEQDSVNEEQTQIVEL